jgi:hypothetical protein
MWNGYGISDYDEQFTGLFLKLDFRIGADSVRPVSFAWTGSPQPGFPTSI